jgi:hypothetical protein
MEATKKQSKCHYIIAQITSYNFMYQMSKILTWQITKPTVLTSSIPHAREFTII